MIKSDSQLYFESLVSPLNGTRTARVTDIKNRVQDTSELTAIRSHLKSDSKHFFFKGILTLLNAINSLDQGLYSWATIKLYYSVFYLLRSDLSIKGTGLFRWYRDPFFLSYDSDKFQKMDGNFRSDHKGVIFLQSTYYSTSDKLLQSNIGDESLTPYAWLMNKREYVNYKHKTFEEPNVPVFWETIINMIQSQGINYVINLYLNDDTLSYCFDEDHSILATPLQRLKQTCINFRNAGETEFLKHDKNEIVNAQILFGESFDDIKEILETSIE